MQTTITIFRKEILDTLRDRRTLYAMVVAPLLLMPLLTILPSHFMVSQMKKQEEEHIRLVVVGGEHAPELVAYLEGTGQVEIVEPPTDLEGALQEGDIPAALAIPADFAEAIAEERPVMVTISSDASKMASSMAASRVQMMVQSYAQQLIAQRLAARGLDPSVLTPIQIKSQNVASEEQMGGSFMAMLLPMFIAIWAVVGGMYTAIDVTAGEKERGTLEALLVTPASRLQIVLGKLLAVITTSLSAVILSVSSMYFSFRFFPVETMAREGEKVAFSLPPQTILLIVLVALPLVVMINSLEIAICIFARSFKEAQNYIVPLQFAVLIPTLPLVMVPDLAMPFVAYAAPIAGAILSFRDLLTGAASGAALALTVASSVIYAAICLSVAVRIFRRERVLFRAA